MNRIGSNSSASATESVPPNPRVQSTPLCGPQDRGVFEPWFLPKHLADLWVAARLMGNPLGARAKLCQKDSIIAILYAGGREEYLSYADLASKLSGTTVGRWVSHLCGRPS